MGHFHYGSATTMHSVRAAIRRLQASLATLSRELGTNPKTVSNCASARRSRISRPAERATFDDLERGQGGDHHRAVSEQTPRVGQGGHSGLNDARIQRVLMFQNKPRGHPPHGHIVQPFSAFAGQRGRPAARARHRDQPRDGALLVEPVRPNVRRTNTPAAGGADAVVAAVAVAPRRDVREDQRQNALPLGGPLIMRARYRNPSVVTARRR